MIKRYCVKIPKDIKIVYLIDKDFIVFIGPLGKKSLRLKVKLFIQESTNSVYVTKQLSLIFSRKQNSFLSLQGTVTASLKQSILEVSLVSFKKLELVGVGYRVLLIKENSESMLQFKLGFSHSIFFKIDSKLKAITHRPTDLYLFGSSSVQVNQTASMIRSYKLPEPYKGKGILYQNEQVKLKEGKKV